MVYNKDLLRWIPNSRGQTAVGIKCNENEPWVKHPTTANMSSSINSSPAATPPSVPAQNAFIAGDLSAMLVFLYILGMCTVGSGYNLIWRVNLGIYSEVYAATTYIYCKPIHQRSWLWVGLPTLYGSQQCIKAVHQCFRGGSEKRLWHCTHMHASHFTDLHAFARTCTDSARTATHPARIATHLARISTHLTRTLHALTRMLHALLWTAYRLETDNSLGQIDGNNLKKL